MYMFILMGNSKSCNKTTGSAFSFCAAFNLPWQNVSTILYIVLLHGTADAKYILQNLWWHFFHNIYAARVQQTRNLCPTEYISQACWHHMKPTCNAR